MAHPQTRSRQSAPLPWLAMLTATLMAVATLQAQRASAPLVDTARTSLAEASAYFDERPYLEPGSALRAYRFPEDLLEKRLAYEREREAHGERPVLPRVQQRQQEELDALDRRAGEALQSLPARRLGIVPTEWRPTTLLTYAGPHSNLWHLTGNLLLLLLLGVYLEPALGVARSAFVLLGATLGAAFGYASAAPASEHVLIGSSGLLAGQLAVFAFTLRASRGEPFYTLSLVGGAGWLALPAALGVGWSFTHPGIELLGAPPDAHLLYWSETGGVVGAMSMALLLRILVRRADEPGLTHTARTSTGSVVLDDALKARAAGREEAAFQQLTILLHQQPEQLDAALLLSDVARSLGRHEKADEAMLRAIRLEAKRDETSAAVRHWLDLARQEIPRGADPALLVRIASLLRHHDYPEAAVAALREALSRATGSNAAPVAARVARSAQELDAKLAHDAAWRALGSTELSLEERQNLEDLLAVVIPRLPGGEVHLSGAWDPDAEKPATIDIDTRTRVLDIVRAVPHELDADGIHIATHGGNKKRVLYERLEAVSVGAVLGLSEKPVLVIDMVLNWRDTKDDRLRVIRLRCDAFDPRRVVPAESPLEAVRGLVSTLLERSGAQPLPDRASALGQPFASFDELRLYERTVLMAESPLSENDS